MPSVVGIDFGNSTCKVAALTPKGMRIIEDEMSNRMTPTLVSFATRQRIIGEPAKALLFSNFRNTTGSLKRLLEVCGSEQETFKAELDLNAFLPCPYKSSDTGEIVMQFEYLGEEHIFSLTQLIAMLLGKLYDRASCSLQQSVSGVMISVPDRFTQEQRKVLLEAAYVAEIPHVHLVNETIALALAFELSESSLIKDKKTKNIVFIDIGHTHCSVSVVDVGRSDNPTKSVVRHSRLGGRDLDWILLRHLATDFKARYKIDILSNKKATMRLLLECESLKKALSSAPDASTYIPSLLDDVDVRATVTQEQYRGLIASLVARVTEPLLRALSLAGITSDQISFVELVGGTTRAPAFKECIKDLLPGALVHTTLNPDDAIARGSAVAAMISLSAEVAADAGLDGVGTYQLNFLKEQEASMKDSDQVAIEVEICRNSLEEYILCSRREISPGESGLQRLQRKKALITLEESEDWLVDDAGQNASKADLVERLRDLRELVELVRNPSHEDAERGNLSDHSAVPQKALSSCKPEDIDKAVHELLAALEVIPRDHPMRRYTLHNLSVAFSLRYRIHGKEADLDKAITASCEAAEAITSINLPNDCMVHISSTLPLSELLMMRYSLLGEVDDINFAISMIESAVNSAHYGHEDLVDFLTRMGSALHERFTHLGIMEDISYAIDSHRKASQLTSYLDPIPLVNLCICYLARFKRSGDPVDIDEALENCQKGLQLTDNQPGLRATCLAQLGHGRIFRYQYHKNVADLAQAISSLEEAELISPSEIMCLSYLGLAYTLHYEHLGEVAAVDITKAINIFERLKKFVPIHDRDLPVFLNSLGQSYIARFNVHGDIEDIRRGVEVILQSAELIPANHALRPELYIQLGVGYMILFQTLGDISDIDRAVEFQIRAERLLPGDSIRKASLLDALGASLLFRFEYLQESRDLDFAIAKFEEAIEVASNNHASYLSNLSLALLRRFELAGSTEDIDQAIRTQEKTVRLLSQTDPQRPFIANNLAISHFASFNRLQRGENCLREAIFWIKEVLRLLPAGHSRRRDPLASHGKMLVERFKLAGNRGDIDLAISSIQEALDALPTDHLSRGRFCFDLGLAFSMRSGLLPLADHFPDSLPDPAGIAIDVIHARDAFFKAAKAPMSSPSQRLNSAIFCMAHIPSFHHPLMMEACSIALDILPRFTWMGFDVKTRQRRLAASAWATLPCDAAATAIASDHLETAVEWLERGRSIIWGQGLHLRTPLDDLKRAAPDLAEQLDRVSKGIEASNFGESNSAVFNADLCEEAAQRHRALTKQWDTLLQEVRAIPKFERFLLPREFSHLQSIAREGPVVVINTSLFRCDALILEQHCVHLVPLPIAYTEIQGLVQQLKTFLYQAGRSILPNERQSHAALFPTSQGNILGFIKDSILRSKDRSGRPVDPAPSQGSKSLQKILEILWTSIVEPVFRALALKPSGDPPRLWWCPTGAIGQLPLHAAGLYSSSEPVNSDDFVVSSYIPTLSILLRDPLPTTQSMKVVAVALPDTPGQPSLPQTKQEVAIIQNIIPKQFLTTLEGSNASVKQLTKEITDCSCLHLACHAYQNIDNPLESAFRLHDGDLQLSHLMQQPLPHADFAFLSACQTAKGDTTTPDEGLHLAGAMLFAGFRSIVATMWSINDQDGPVIAKAIYSDLFKNAPFNSKLAARALHHALGTMRHKGIPLERRVAFIHLGQ